MEETAKEKLFEALENLKKAAPKRDLVEVTRCEMCAHYDSKRNFCHIWQLKTPLDGYCYRGNPCCLELDKTYLEDYLEKHPDAKRVYGYPAVYPCDEYNELYGWCCGNCRECWNKRMIAKEEKEND